MPESYFFNCLFSRLGEMEADWKATVVNYTQLMPVAVGRCSGLHLSTTLGGGAFHVHVRDVRAGSACGQDRRIQEANLGHVLSAFTPVACSCTLSFSHDGSPTLVKMGNALG